MICYNVYVYDGALQYCGELLSCNLLAQVIIISQTYENHVVRVAFMILL